MATIYYLEMRSAKQKRVRALPPGVWVKQIRPPEPVLNAWFYQQVGKAWQWTDRLSWNDKQWQEYAAREELLTFVGYQHDQAIGYFELERQPPGDVQLAYFGLLPNSIGQGLGAGFLSSAVERAWALPDTQRVWVHTCSDDHPNALDNYRKRGFQQFALRTETDD
jgi:GNAT superfamily N-acetyltransferase